MGKRRAGKNRPEAIPTSAQLESFVALVRWGKQAAAQSALGRSQSQVSRDLSSLENALNVRLLDRQTRRVTPAGEVLLVYAEQVLGGWEAVRERLRGEFKVAGSVTLAAPDEVHDALLVPLLSRLRARWEGLSVRTLLVGPYEGAEKIRSGAADMGLLPLGNYEGLNMRPLCNARLHAVVAATSPWVSQKSVPRNPGADACILLVGGSTSAVGDLFGRMLDTIPDRKVQVSELGGGRQTLVNAVAARLGVGWLLTFEEMGDPLPRTLPAEVVLKPIARMPARVSFGLAVRKGRVPGGVVEFVLREVLRHFRR